ncbi:hypothetical protein [Thalassospira marina]|uniref:Uncharacterized protein n=1 Tax=Thalassospira marina TaxID=2048283 RepID=A0A2N3KCY7_9PROT|nr:hypothetical protein [Thalassospira marina]PKR48447.1 hypothetical protein COO20_24625 [Thalassospira marina]
MKNFENQTATISGPAETPRYVEVTVEQLTVYRYLVPADADDAEGVALDRFNAGDVPDLGPAEGEQHDLTTYFVGDYTGADAPLLTYAAWCAEYRPVPNTTIDNAPFDGALFETFGPELEAVHAAGPACVWTLVGCGDGLYVLSGLHLVNRLGYFITERPWAGDVPVEIRID